MNKVYANTIQNLDKPYSFKFFLRGKRGAACDMNRHAEFPHSDDTIFKRV